MTKIKEQEGKVLGRWREGGWSESVRTLAPWMALWIASALGLWREHSVFGTELLVLHWAANSSAQSPPGALGGYPPAGKFLGGCKVSFLNFSPNI